VAHYKAIFLTRRSSIRGSHHNVKKKKKRKSSARRFISDDGDASLCRCLAKSRQI